MQLCLLWRGENILEKLGERITYYRKMRNYTRKELVEGICDESTLFRIEKGNNQPSFYIVNELCKRLNIPMTALFEKEEDNSILSLQQQCRRYVYTKDYENLSKTLQELENVLNLTKKQTYEDRMFILWHQAIVLHKLHDESTKAKEMLLEAVPENPLLEIELSVLNTVGLICFSMAQKEDASHYFESAFHNISFDIEFKDPTLPIRVAYSYASQLYYQYKYRELIEIISSTLNYLELNYLFYMKGRLYYLLGKAYGKTNRPVVAGKQFKLALEIFKSENKEEYVRIVENEIALLNKD